MGVASFSVEVGSEAETEHGWCFGVFVRSGGGESAHTAVLSWVDYEFWSHGQASPSRVVEAVFGALVSHEENRRGVDALPALFDLSTARRWLPGLDALVRERL